jgi:hypothetical protein
MPDAHPQLGAVLVTGVYLADCPNAIAEIVPLLDATEEWKVDQRWIALGGAPPTPAVARVTIATERRRSPKYRLLNELLATAALGDYDYVLTCDDDVTLPPGFLDRFLAAQRRLDLSLAQPARTTDSSFDHPIVRQEPGLLGRRTRFVEVGPVVSFARDTYDLMFPFDLSSPMGWGYETVWAWKLARMNLQMGIVDAVPVGHTLRPRAARYSGTWARLQELRYLRANEHLPYSECYEVLERVTLEG